MQIYVMSLFVLLSKQNRGFLLATDGPANEETAKMKRKIVHPLNWPLAH